MTENDRTSHVEPQVEPTLRGLLEQPKGVLQKNLKTFVYLGAVLLVIVAALFSSSGRKRPRSRLPPKAATATHVAGQHRQQRAGLEEPGAGRTPERATGGNGRRCRARSSACVCDARATAAAAAFGPSGEASTACAPGRPCGQAQQGAMPRNLLPRRNKHSSLPRKSASEPTIPDSLPILCTPVLPSSSHSSRSPKVRRYLSSMTILSARQRRISLTHRLKRNTKSHAEAITASGSEH